MIGTKIKLIRLEKGLTQLELANLIGENVTQQNIQQLESDVVENPRYLKKLLNILGVTFESLHNSPIDQIIKNHHVYDPIIKEIIDDLQNFSKSEKNQVLTQVKLILAKKELDRLTLKNS